MGKYMVYNFKHDEYEYEDFRNEHVYGCGVSIERCSKSIVIASVSNLFVLLCIVPHEPLSNTAV